MYILTSAAGRAALCLPALGPSVGGAKVSVHTGIRRYVVGVWFLLDDVTIVTLVDHLL